MFSHSTIFILEKSKRQSNHGCLYTDSDAESQKREGTKEFVKDPRNDSSLSMYCVLAQFLALHQSY